jgi:phage tail protein X
MITYTTRAGDTADYIAAQYYGDAAPQATEQLLDANPGLADLGPILPAGLVVNLPTIDTAAKAEGVRLWD